MFKKTVLLIFSGILMLNLYGCFAIFAGVAGGAGTAVWLSGKLTQEFHNSYQATIDATKEALQSLNLKVIKETDEDKITQFKCIYSNGKEMWVDIHKVTEHSTMVEVRVGVISPDKDAANKVLKNIESKL